MATSTISALTAVTAPNLTDAAVLAVDDANGNTRKATLAQLRTRLNTGAQVFTAGLSGITTLDASGVISSSAASGSVGAFKSPANGIAVNSADATPLSIANNATSNLCVNGAGATGVKGLLLIYDDTSGAAAVFIVAKTNMNIIINRPSGGVDWTLTPTNPNSFNVYISGGNLVLENKSGATGSVRWAFYRI